MRFADEISRLNVDNFYIKYSNELVDVIQHISGETDEDKIYFLYELCQKHSADVKEAIAQMNRIHNDPFEILSPKSFFSSILGEREYKKEPYILITSRICSDLMSAIPIAFHSRRPENENQLNDYIESFLNLHQNDYEREFGLGSFALAKTYVDHNVGRSTVLIESKYIRNSTTPSVATEGFLQISLNTPRINSNYLSYMTHIGK